MVQSQEVKARPKPLFIRGLDPGVYRKARAIATLQGRFIGPYITEALIYYNNMNETVKKEN